MSRCGHMEERSDFNSKRTEYGLLGDDKVLVKMQHNSNGNRYTRQLFASENNIHIGMFKEKQRIQMKQTILKRV